MTSDKTPEIQKPTPKPDLETELRAKIDEWLNSVPRRETEGGDPVYVLTTRKVAQLYDVVSRMTSKAYKGGADDAGKAIKAELARRATRVAMDFKNGRKR